MKYFYYNENGVKVSGVAAFNHLVYTKCGGVNNYNKMVGEKLLRNLLKHFQMKLIKILKLI